MLGWLDWLDGKERVGRKDTRFDQKPIIECLAKQARGREEAHPWVRITNAKSLADDAMRMPLKGLTGQCTKHVGLCLDSSQTGKGGRAHA